MPSDDHHTQGLDRPLLGLHASGMALKQALGAPHLRNVDSNGMGPADGWKLRFHCGLELHVWLFLLRPDGSSIEDDREPAYVELWSNARDAKHILFHFPLPAPDLSYWEPILLIPEPLAWRVLRQDDNGNRAEVGRYSSRCEAEAVAQAYEARGHKQTYWVEETAGPGMVSDNH